MQTQTNRYDFLDWLRVIAVFMLLFYHTGMLFVGWGWHIQNAETISALGWPMDIAHRLRMPLLFMIAGAGMWFALQRRNAAQVAAERSLRLLLPLVAGMFLIVPPQLYFERVFHGQWQGGYAAFLWERVFQFRLYPQGDFAWHHLWFIAYLYVYALLLLPLCRWWPRKPQLRPGSWLYLLALPLCVNEALLKSIFPETHNLVRDWYVFDHYLLLTVYGFLLASIPGCWDWLSAQRRCALAVALLTASVVISLLVSGVIAHGGTVDAFLANVFTWLALIAILGYGHRYLSFQNPLLRWARDASYPIYILHQSVIIVIGYFVIQRSWSPWLKFGVVVSATLLICVLLYQLLLRRFAVLRSLFGIKIHAQHSQDIDSAGGVERVRGWST
ncbi:MAG: acyltransferase family protein [Steroidobacteraceae bacterium]